MAARSDGLRRWVVGAAALGLCGTAILWRGPAVQAQGGGPAPGSVQFYQARVLPVFQANCYRCHGGLNHRGGLNIETYAGMMKGGHDGAVLVPGHPEQSLLIKLIRHEGPADDPMPMPPKSKLSDADIAAVTAWVQGGAKMPQ